MNTFDRLICAADDCKVTYGLIHDYRPHINLRSIQFECYNRARTVKFQGVVEQILTTFRNETSRSLKVEGTDITISEVSK
jgi:hypothetical protein